MPEVTSELGREFERDPRTRKFYEYARELQRAGKLGEALSVCDQGLKVHANHTQARILQAQLLLATGDLKAAKNAVERALLVLPDNVAANHLAADIYRGLGERTLALKHYQIVHLFDPSSEGVDAQIRELARAEGSADGASVVPGGAVEEILGPADRAEAPRPVGHDPKVPEVAGEASRSLAPEAAPADPPVGQAPAEAAAGLASVEPPPAVAEEVIAFPEEVGAVEGEVLSDLESVVPDLGEDLLDVGEATVWSNLTAEQARDAAGPKGPVGVEPASEEEEDEPPRTSAPPAAEVRPPDSGDSMSTVTLARLYEQQGYPEKAVEVYQRLLIRNPDDPEILGRIRELREQVERGSVEHDLVDQEEIQRALRQRRVRALSEWLRRMREERHVS